jgi:hypothetical protein
MIRGNWQLVADELVEFEKYPVEVEDCRKLPIILVQFIEYTPNY